MKNIFSLMKTSTYIRGNHRRTGRVYPSGSDEGTNLGRLYTEEPKKPEGMPRRKPNTPKNARHNEAMGLVENPSREGHQDTPLNFNTIEEAREYLKGWSGGEYTDEQLDWLQYGQHGKVPTKQAIDELTAKGKSDRYIASMLGLEGRGDEDVDKIRKGYVAHNTGVKYSPDTGAGEGGLDLAMMDEVRAELADGQSLEDALGM